MFRGRYELRDRALFLLQYYTGRRISQTLALRIGDLVTDMGNIVERIYYKRGTVKGKVHGESVLLLPKSQQALRSWLVELRSMGFMLGDHFVFQAQGNVNRALTRHAAYQIYKKAFKRAGLQGRLGTHSLRKAFGRTVYYNSDCDIQLAQAALGHRDPESTAKYIDTSQTEIDRILRQCL